MTKNSKNDTPVIELVDTFVNSFHNTPYTPENIASMIDENLHEAYQQLQSTPFDNQGEFTQHNFELMTNEIVRRTGLENPISVETPTKVKKTRKPRFMMYAKDSGRGFTDYYVMVNNVVRAVYQHNPTSDSLVQLGMYEDILKAYSKVFKKNKQDFKLVHDIISMVPAAVEGLLSTEMIHMLIVVIPPTA